MEMLVFVPWNQIRKILTWFESPIFNDQIAGIVPDNPQVLMERIKAKQVLNKTRAFVCRSEGSEESLS
jgi:hypothetical protein